MQKILFLCLFISVSVFGQDKNPFTLDVSLIRGNAMSHSEDMSHLVNGHPEGRKSSIRRYQKGAP